MIQAASRAACIKGNPVEIRNSARYCNPPRNKEKPMRFFTTVGCARREGRFSGGKSGNLPGKLSVTHSPGARRISTHKRQMNLSAFSEHFLAGFSPLLYRFVPRGNTTNLLADLFPYEANALTDLRTSDVTCRGGKSLPLSLRKRIFKPLNKHSK